MFFNVHTHTSGPSAIYNASIDDVPEQELFSIGIHPKDIGAVEDLLPFIQNENCVAIGECGLDNLVNIPLNQQKEIFETQIQLANQYNKPLIIHVVKAHGELLTCLKKLNNQQPVIIHGFNNNQNVLKEYLQNDCYISLGKALLIENSNAQQALLNTPIDSIFFETDMADISIEDIYIKGADLLKVDLNELVNNILRNIKTVFGI